MSDISLEGPVPGESPCHVSSGSLPPCLILSGPERDAYDPCLKKRITFNISSRPALGDHFGRGHKGGYYFIQHYLTHAIGGRMG